MSLKPGEELKITCYAVFRSEKLDISDLVTLPQDELEKMETASVAKEEDIYGKIEDMIAEWSTQAEMTIRLRKAREYLKVSAIQHTSNQWVKKEYGWYERSNMVYKMTYRISEGTVWKSPQHQPTYWDLFWNLTFNAPHKLNYYGSGRKIAGQQKRFLDKSEMEKYLQGRIKAYSRLFTEISPPIPEEHQKKFFVNGILLPGYTIESPEQYAPDEAAVDDLLAFLSDEDLAVESEEAPPREPPPEQIWSRNRRNRQDAVQKKQAPIR